MTIEFSNALIFNDSDVRYLFAKIVQSHNVIGDRGANIPQRPHSRSVASTSSAISGLYMFSAICHIWRMLSSETEAHTNSSLGFHEKSHILDVWPPWMNSSSGGPREEETSTTISINSNTSISTHTSLAPASLALSLKTLTYRLRHLHWSAPLRCEISPRH
jgi:hypothetical protein